MGITDCFEKLNILDENYMEILLKPSIKIDDYQFAAVNGSLPALLHCMRDRNTENCLIYDFKGFISLGEYILKKSFDFYSLKDLLLKISNNLIEMNNSNIVLSNTLVKLDYIFINNYNQSIKIINVPVLEKNDMNNYKESLGNLIKDIVCQASITDANELVGWIIENIKQTDFDINSFQQALIKKKKSSFGLSAINNREGFIVTFMITVISIFVVSIGVPLIANVIDINMFKRYINLSALWAFSSLFILGAVIALILNVLINKCKEGKVVNIQDNLVETLKDFNNKENNDAMTIGDSKLVDNENKDKAVHEVTNDNHILNSDKLKSSTTILEINRETRKKESKGTQVLFKGESSPIVYIVPKGEVNDTNKVFIDSSEFTIGRLESGTNLKISQITVSKKHAVIKRQNNEYYLSDLRSKNGTFINGLKLKPNNPIKLCNGDTIIFGNQHYEFFYKDEN